jgi:hypothetical protein
MLRLLAIATLLPLCLGEICDEAAGWRTFEGTLEPKEHCYMYIDNNPNSADSGESTWYEGQAGCESRGGDLASIRNAEENGNVMGLCSTFRCWIGQNDLAAEVGGNYAGWSNYNNGITYGQSCSSGSECSSGTWGYHAWSSGEPNNWIGLEDCSEMWNHGSGVGTWNDMPCGSEFGWSKQNEYVCEMPPGCPTGYWQSGTSTSLPLRGKGAVCDICPRGKVCGQTPYLPKSA